jgi:hypothetical protein
MSKENRIRFFIYSPLASVFLISGLLLAWGAGTHWYLGRYEFALLTITATIAVFAVNFSFLEYQFSPYRAALRVVAPSHVTAASLVLFLALAPIAAAVLQWHTVAVAVFVIPLVMLSSIALALLARHNADPLSNVRRDFGESRLRQFLRYYAQNVRKQLDEISRLQLSTPKQMPMHEFDRRTPPPSELADPYQFAASILAIAIERSDLYVLDHILQMLLRACDYAEGFRDITGRKLEHPVDEVVRQYSVSVLDEVARRCRIQDKTGACCSKFLDVASAYIRRACGSGAQGNKLCRGVLEMMTATSKQLLNEGLRNEALTTIVVAREAVQKGMESPNTTQDLFFEALRAYVAAPKILGYAATGLGNADFLYRCLDALGWLGCSAVQLDNVTIGIECLQGLIQLGRKSRAANLACFWDSCALSPYDHADERLSWMLSWVFKLTPERQKRWLGLFGEAKSRLTGRTITITIDSDKPAYTFHEEDKPYKILFSSEGHHGEIDFSDPQCLKEFRIY